MTTKLLLIAVTITFVSAGTLAQNRGPSETVKSFYRFSSAHSNLFNRRHVESRKSWYTNELYHLFLEQLKKDEANLKAHPTDKPFFGDGLDFEPLHELCNAGGKSYSYTRRVGRAKVKGQSAFVDVTFSYPSACTEPAIVWQVELKRLGGKWLIADWIWPEGSSLTADMKANNP